MQTGVGMGIPMIHIDSYLAVYAAMNGGGVAVYAIAYVVFVYGCLRASRVLHRDLVQSVLGTTLRWLDKTPTSRVITRCTQDIQASTYALRGVYDSYSPSPFGS